MHNSILSLGTMESEQKLVGNRSYKCLLLVHFFFSISPSYAASTWHCPEDEGEVLSSQKYHVTLAI